MTYFNISENTKVFVYCPAGIVTGGAELLHQLVDVINRNGGNAFIVYYGEKTHEVPKDYEKYNIKIAENAEDDQQNVVVIFEGYFKKLFELNNAQVLLWWLSVDNYFICQASNLTIKDLIKYSFTLGIRILVKKIIKYFIGKREMCVFSLEQLAGNGLVKCNGYQSEYAKDFLEKKNFKNIYPLKDFINAEHFFDETVLEKKENVVLYNPKKGIIFTRKLIKAAPDINWKPIQNMSRVQVIECLKTSKVYIDFGYHPGKDRLPREAAMNGCCVITGKLGSAGFYGDIPIDENEYKFSQRNKDISKIISKIRFELENYGVEIMKFKHYRDCIKNEKEEFENQVKDLFRIRKKTWGLL